MDFTDALCVVGSARWGACGTVRKIVTLLSAGLPMAFVTARIEKDIEDHHYLVVNKTEGVAYLH